MNTWFGRLLIWVVIVALITAIERLESLTPDEFDGPRRPLPPAGEAWWNSRSLGPPTGPTPTEPAYEMWVQDAQRKGDSIGTAFQVAPGTWVTAGHVLENCATAYVRIRGQWQGFKHFTIHPVADVAIATTELRDLAPRIDVTARLPVMNQTGFHFGYPQGTPSSVYTRFVGMARVRLGGPGTPVEQGWVWVEQRRDPPGFGSLGGISGGPQVDRTGAVQGVTVLHSEKAARVVTTPISRLREILPADVPIVDAGPTSIDGIDYIGQGRRVRDSGAVSLVFCSVSGRTRPRS